MDRIIKTRTTPIDKSVKVVGSKSMTNRALLMAALSGGKCTLNNVLLSDDSRYFLKSLSSLGFFVKVYEEDEKVEIQGLSGEIPKREGEIYVGSAGTAARFLTAMLAFSDGVYRVNSSEQMKKRPMKDLFVALEKLGITFDFQEKEYSFPVVIHGKRILGGEAEIDISSSTQYLSALMMAGVMCRNFKIRVTSEKKGGSYINITKKQMEEFGAVVTFDGECYSVSGAYRAGEYEIEPDVSAACYFYSLPMLLGGKVTVRGVHLSSCQGDIKFLRVLEKKGAKLEEGQEGLSLSFEGEYDGFDENMNDFSDQALTLAVLAAYAKTPTKISGISHVRGQECDRINAICHNLNMLGAIAKETDDGVIITPRPLHGAKINTFDDHRVAMSFALSGLKTEGVIIENAECCKKTFEHFFDVFDETVSE